MSRDQSNLSDDDVLASEWKKQVGPEAGALIDVFRNSLELEAYLEKNPQPRELVKLAYQKVGDATHQLFESTDITTPECQQAHFEGRVGLTILSWVHGTLVEGKTAEDLLRAEADMEDTQDEYREG